MTAWKQDIDVNKTLDCN